MINVVHITYVDVATLFFQKNPCDSRTECVILCKITLHASHGWYFFFFKTKFSLRASRRVVTGKSNTLFLLPRPAKARLIRRVCAGPTGIEYVLERYFCHQIATVGLRFWLWKLCINLARATLIHFPQKEEITDGVLGLWMKYLLCAPFSFRIFSLNWMFSPFYPHPLNSVGKEDPPVFSITSYHRMPCFMVYAVQSHTT